jgi:pimeloyl-ACP methyl ester carboxylesterase
MSLRRKIAVRYIKTKFKLLSALSKRKAAEQAFDLFCTPQVLYKKEPAAIFSKAEKLHFSFEGYTISGYRWNPSDKKVLILHGFSSTILNFDHFVKPLIKKGYEVLAFDAPAHGASTGKRINVVLYKEFIEKVYELYGPIKSFIAHSLGGLSLALALEDIQHDETYRVALIAPATETTTSIDFYFNLLKLDKGVRKEFDALIEEVSGGHTPDWFSVRRAAKHIKAQVLWLHDEVDELTPWSDARKVQEADYPNFHFIVTKGLGHRRIYRDKKMVDRVIDFF